MSKSRSAPSTDAMAITGQCLDCGWEYERALDAGDELTEEQNQDIAYRVVRSHAFKCGASGFQNEWGDVADVEVNMSGGDADATM